MTSFIAFLPLPLSPPQQVVAREFEGLEFAKPKYFPTSISLSLKIHGKLKLELLLLDKLEFH